MSESDNNKCFPRLENEVAGEVKSEKQVEVQREQDRQTSDTPYIFQCPRTGPQSNSVLFNRALDYLQQSGSINLLYPSTFWQRVDSLVFYEHTLEIIVCDRLFAASWSHQLIH